MVVDVTDPTSPVEVAFVAGPEPPAFPPGYPLYIERDIKTRGSYAYVLGTKEDYQAGGGDGLQVVDLSNLPVSATLLNTYSQTFSTGSAVSIEGDHLYVSGADYINYNPVGSLRVLSLVDPVFPVEVGTYDEYFVYDTFVSGGLGYSMFFSAGEVGILDLSNPGLPLEVGEFNTPSGGPRSAWLADDGTTLAVIDYGSGYEGNTGISFWDVSDPANAVLLSNFRGPSEEDPDASAYAVRINGNLAFVAWLKAGIRILDISDPTLPVEVGWFATSPAGPSPNVLYDGMWGVYPYLESGTLLVTDNEDGLFALSYPEQYGVVVGTVRDSVTLQLIEGAQVRAGPSGSRYVTAADGRYGLDADPGDVRIAAVAPGYRPGIVHATAPLRARAVVDVALTPLPAGGISGTVTRPGGSPLPGARIAVRETPFSAVSGAGGEYVLLSVPEGSYTLVASLQGHGRASAEVSIRPGQTVPADFVLAPAVVAADMESDHGWSAGIAGDTATGGVWTRDAPIGTVDGGVVFQTDMDHTADPGTMAYVTGQGPAGGSAGLEDVDGGFTTLLTPPFDLSSIASPVITYYRWYVNEFGNNAPTVWRVDASVDGGGIWIPFECNKFSYSRWYPVRRHALDVLSPFQDLSAVQFRFVAEDSASLASIVEAGVDDFEILDSCDARALRGVKDRDADGVADACDPWPTDPLDDVDRDRRAGPIDNAPLTYNPSQSDADADGVGDVADNCPGSANPEQADTDADGAGDACDGDDDGDGVPDASDADADGDGVPDGQDICPGIPNPNQLDRDADGAGDACDADDGVVGTVRVLSEPGGRIELRWSAETGTDQYNVYRGQIDGPATVAGAECLVAIPGGQLRATDTSLPAPGGTSFYLVTPVAAGVEGSAGFESSGLERLLIRACEPLIVESVPAQCKPTPF